MPIEEQDPDAIFAELTAGLDLNEDTNVPDFTQWPKYKLAIRFNEVKNLLHKLSQKTQHPELVTPSCEEARELHSEYYALFFEMKRRVSEGE